MIYNVFSGTLNPAQSILTFEVDLDTVTTNQQVKFLYFFVFICVYVLYLLPQVGE